MTQTSSSQRRAWQGPALFSHGFRPFFFFAALWALIAMALWIAMLAGRLDLPTRFDPISWHAHAFLVGYLGAVLGGFLLTAVPNWTGRLPVVGLPLAWLTVLWGLGRVAGLVSLGLPGWLFMALDLGSLLVLAGFLAREIIAGKNWRNLVMLVLLLAFITGAALFDLAALRGEAAYQGAGFRLLMGTAILMIAVIGGRIVPSFTRNWLVQQKDPARPAPPMQRFDKAALLALVAALGLWLFDSPLAGPALLAAGLAHLVRLARWQGLHTSREPLLLILHLAYAFVPLGALALGAALIAEEPTGTALHIWTAGAVTLMTVAVMTRATLGHTGHALHAGKATVALYACLLGAMAARLVAGLGLGDAHLLYSLSGVLWIAGFGGFLMLYGPMLLRPRAGAA
ncbi:NnrS family protein [Pseudoruegeria sp. SHC-113]|uniref:NnrS family protein n=1 Tax=Pseudoruegeria sp. SHC-113 TaxID=2855439 RepID=UPI0021BB001F|nr:NnrS family protein [Pseudoruegeria sp. SHC-113]MCT8160168.1 NnrS family protein [Pseudoruegeria sp. SHC-113]